MTTEPIELELNDPFLNPKEHKKYREHNEHKDHRGHREPKEHKDHHEYQQKGNKPPSQDKTPKQDPVSSTIQETAKVSETAKPEVIGDNIPVKQAVDGLPVLPPKLPPPQRQALPSASSGGPLMRQRVPNLNQVTKPQVNIPPGSDLGVVGKLSAYQVAHGQPVSSAAVDMNANIFFWFHLITLLTLFIVMKKKY